MRLLVSPTALSAIAIGIGMTWLIVLVVLFLVDQSDQRNADTATTQSFSSIEVRLRAMGDITSGAVAAVAAFGQGAIARQRNTTGDPAAFPTIIRRFSSVYSPRLVNSAPYPSGIFMARNSSVSQLYPTNASTIFPLGTNMVNNSVCIGNFSITTVVDTSQYHIRHVVLCVPVFTIGNVSSPKGDFWGYAIVSIDEPTFVSEVSNSDEIFLIGNDSDHIFINSYAQGTDVICPLATMTSLSFGEASLKLWFCGTDAQSRLGQPLVWVAVFFFPIAAAVLGLLAFHLVAGITMAILQRELRLHAPVNPPVAIAVVGICHSEMLWGRYPKVMHHVLKAFNARVAARRDSMHGLQTEAPLQHTSDVMFKDVHHAIMMCMDLVEDVTNNPIYAPDALQLAAAEGSDDVVDEGEVLEAEAAAVAAAEASSSSTVDGRTKATPSLPVDGVRMAPITISCVVHWCTKITLREHDLQSRSVHCQGEDLVLASKLYHFSSSNAVMVSEAAVDNNVVDPATLSLVSIGSVQLRGHKAKHQLFSAVSPAHPNVVSPPPLPTGEFLQARGAKSDATANLLPIIPSDVASSGGAPTEKSHSNTNINPLQSGHNRLSNEDEWDVSRVGADRRTQGGGTTPEGEDNSSIPSMRRLLATNIPMGLERQFIAGFEDLAMFNPNLEFKDIKHVIYHYYCAFQTLFRPFAPAERANIQRRLITTFGVSQDNLLESLAVKCALRQATEVDNLIALQHRKKARQAAGGSSSDVVSDDVSENNNF